MVSTFAQPIVKRFGATGSNAHVVGQPVTARGDVDADTCQVLPDGEAERVRDGIAQNLHRWTQSQLVHPNTGVGERDPRRGERFPE